MGRPSPHASSCRGVLVSASVRGHNGQIPSHILLLVIIALWLCAAAVFDIRTRRNRAEAKRWRIAADELTVPGIGLPLLFRMGFSQWFVFSGVALLLAAGICRLVYNRRLQKMSLPQRGPTLPR